MLRRIVVLLLIVLGLLAVVDRFMANAAGDAAGGQVRRAASTPANARVSFRGFPFVTQALRGRFDRVDVVARDVPAGGLTLDRVDARFDGVHVRLGKALAGELEAVPSDGADATARLTYADLNAYLRRRGSLTVTEANGQLEIAGNVRVKGAQISGKGRAKVALRPGSIVLQVTSASANGATVPQEAARLLTVTVPTDAMPFGMALTSVEIADDALILRGTATRIVIPTKKLVG
ncbi:MAG: DUF2993 domain-containing protein [Mycobacteriales bacterium]